MIAETLLESYGAKKLRMGKGTMIFSEGDSPNYYYQIRSGEVKMNNYNEEGKEFIQNIFSVGQSFGEPPLFVDSPYPANAMALTEVELLVLRKEDFIELLGKEPTVALSIIQGLSRRLLYKAVMAPEISSQGPGRKLLTLLNFQKKSHAGVSEPCSFKVPLTRQQMADLTGLRVETVIRAIKQLEKDGVLKIERGKVFF